MCGGANGASAGGTALWGSAISGVTAYSAAQAQGIPTSFRHSSASGQAVELQRMRGTGDARRDADGGKSAGDGHGADVAQGGAQDGGRERRKEEMEDNEDVRDDLALLEAQFTGEVLRTTCATPPRPDPPCSPRPGPYTYSFVHPWHAIPIHTRGKPQGMKP